MSEIMDLYIFGDSECRENFKIVYPFLRGLFKNDVLIEKHFTQLFKILVAQPSILPPVITVLPPVITVPLQS